MNDVKLTSATLLVVCDGAKALFLKNEGPVNDPRLAMVDVIGQPDEPARALGSDRPGRAFQSSGTSRSAMEETDWHDAAEEQFLRSVAMKLSDFAGQGLVKNFVLVAPPKALGLLRSFIAPAVSSAIVHEIAADLTGKPVPEIARRFAA